MFPMALLTEKAGRVDIGLRGAWEGEAIEDLYSR